VIQHGTGYIHEFNHIERHHAGHTPAASSTATSGGAAASAASPPPASVGTQYQRHRHALTNASEPPTAATDNQATALDSQVSAFGTSPARSTRCRARCPLWRTRSARGFDATSSTRRCHGERTVHAVAAIQLAVQNLATSATLTSKAFASSGRWLAPALDDRGRQRHDVDQHRLDRQYARRHCRSDQRAANNPASAPASSRHGRSRLVLSGTTTGASNAITVTQTAATGLVALVYDRPTSHQPHADPGSDGCEFHRQRLPCTNSSNVVAGVISGVTLNLVAHRHGTSTTLTVSPDTTTASTSIARSSRRSTGVERHSDSDCYDPTTQTAELCRQRDAAIVQSQLENILDTVNSSTSGVASLADLGITSDPNGSWTATRRH